MRRVTGLQNTHYTVHNGVFSGFRTTGDSTVFQKLVNVISKQNAKYLHYWSFVLESVSYQMDSP